MHVRVDFELTGLSALQRMMFYGVGYGYRTAGVLLRLYAPFDRTQLERELFGMVRANLLELSTARGELSYSRDMATLMQAALERRVLDVELPGELQAAPLPLQVIKPAHITPILERHLGLLEPKELARKLHLWLHSHESSAR